MPQKSSTSPILARADGGTAAWTIKEFFDRLAQFDPGQ